MKGLGISLLPQPRVLQKSSSCSSYKLQSFWSHDTPWEAWINVEDAGSEDMYLECLAFTVT